MSAPATGDLSAWLQQANVSLAFTTYRANRLMLVGRSEDNRLKINERLFDRPMGLYVHGNSLWMATRSQLWRLDNFLEAGQTHAGADRLYVPAMCVTTGDVNAHELVIQADGSPLFVNTAFSCLATIAPGASFVPVWQPHFIQRLTADDRCHLNGLAMQHGQPTWATACGHSDQSAGWRNHRVDGGVLLHIPTNRIAATGLSMPHSPRWHKGRIWLLNSGTGELGWIEGERFVALTQFPGFARGLALVGDTAVVGLSKMRSPQFTGLALEARLQGSAHPSGCCGLRVVDLKSGAILAALDLPEPIDELFDVAVLPGVREPRALGLQGEDIQCLVKLPNVPQLITVRPKAPSGKPHQGEAPPLFGLPEPGPQALRYQQVFQLTPQTLAPYTALTFPPLDPGSARLGAVRGELLGISVMSGDTMVGLALAERNNQGGASLLSLKVDAGYRRQGIGLRLVLNLQRFLQQQGATELVARWQGNSPASLGLEPLLRRLEWSAPMTEFLLLQGSAERGAATGWHTRFPIAEPYRVFPWMQATRNDMARAQTLGAAAVLLPPATAEGLEAAVSLGLRHNGQLVGWVIAHRVDATTVRYSSLFVAEGHRGRARGLALLAEGVTRQHAAGIPQAKGAIHANNAEFLRVFQRHLRHLLDGVGEARMAVRGLLLPLQA